MSVHVADYVSFETIHGWRVSPTFWLWFEDTIAAVGLATFIGSAWLLTALVQATTPS